MPSVRPNVDIAQRQSKQFASDDWDRTYDWPAAKILEGAAPVLGYTEMLLTPIVVNKQVWKDSLELVNLTLLN